MTKFQMEVAGEVLMKVERTEEGNRNVGREREGGKRRDRSRGGEKDRREISETDCSKSEREDRRMRNISLQCEQEEEYRGGGRR
jgi:hypothetical protein